MKLAVFNPYGLMDQESGVVYLLANFLGKQGAEVLQLRCDGAQQACARDVLSGGVRTPFSCSQCSGEQAALAQWCGARPKALSSLLSPSDISQTAQWLAAAAGDALFRVEFRGVNLWEQCREQFVSQWKLQPGQELTPQLDRSLRQLFTSYMHTRIASERFIAASKATAHFVTRPRDAASSAYLAEARAASGSEIATFSFSAEDEAILIETDGSPHRYETRLVLQGITSMRSDFRTWAPEVTAMVHEMLSFLGYAPDRLA
jgi:hypothetical protein